MAHHITKNKLTQKVEMAYVGEVPWHGLGNILVAGASMEAWLEAAGMLWTVRRAKVHYYADRAQQDLRRDDDMVVLTRSDTGEKLGIVSADYEVVQPYEILEFFRDLVEGQGFQIETAGTMFGGKRYWALAKVTEATIAGWDKIGSYVLLCTSADGSRATEGRETTVRVVCHNTISAALSEDVKRAVRISHRQAFDEKAMKEKLGLVRENFAAFIEAANLLTKVKVTDAAAEDFVLKLLRPSKEAMELIAAEAPADTLAALLNKPFKPKDVEQDLETILRRPRGCDDILALFHGAG